MSLFKVVNKSYHILGAVFILIFYVNMVSAQIPAMVVNLAMLEGQDLTPDNIFNIQIISNESVSKRVTVMGTISYKRAIHNIRYTYTTTIQPGVNSLSKDVVGHPDFVYSSTALKELFQNYHKLPQGTYEYCVSIAFEKNKSEQLLGDPVVSCIYQTVNDIFLINLVAPEDDAEIYEHYPMLSWVVNYPFASELQYRLRVAERKEGQNKQSAINRNNPVYKDKHVFATSQIYPVTARPLKTHQPYVWTVDAYYKNILLGGAEVWQFTIVEDDTTKVPDANTSYVDVRKDRGFNMIYAKGELKLKYFLGEKEVDTIKMSITKPNGKNINMVQPEWVVKYGDNRMVIPFREDYNLKHKKDYKLEFTNGKGKKYMLLFKYINPEF